MNVLDQSLGEKFAMYHGDCIEVIRGLPDASVHYSIFSPPFASLYCYSSSPRDLGNVADQPEFWRAFRYLAPELYRVLKPGRLLSAHVMNLPTSKVRDGVIGLTDFRGELIRAFVECGWVYHSEVVIWKDPVTAMQRTKALGLLHKTIRKDSAMSRQGLPDYLITFRKPGENPEPIAHEMPHLPGQIPECDLPVAVWQRYASPVWVTTRGVDDEGFAVCSGETVAGDASSSIDPGDTLQHRSAREDEDERHICPLQLEVIRRAIKLWTNPGDTVLSPFGGIGSEVVTAVEMGRRGVGIELKKSYYDQAVRNLIAASVETKKQLTIGGQ